MTTTDPSSNSAAELGVSDPSDQWLNERCACSHTRYLHVPGGVEGTLGCTHCDCGKFCLAIPNRVCDCTNPLPGRVDTSVCFKCNREIPHATRNRVPQEWIDALDHALNVGEPSHEQLLDLGNLLAWLRGDDD